MANIEISTRFTEGVDIGPSTFDNRVLTAAGAETWPAGAVLANNVAGTKLVRMVPAAGDATAIAIAVLTRPVEFAGAGDKTERPLIEGKVRRRDLVDDQGVAITDAAVLSLRDYSILAIATEQTTAFDNQ